LTTFVIDASALVEYLLGTPSGARAASLIESGASLHIPTLADIEVTSALVRLLTRRMMTIDRAAEALSDLSLLPLTRHGHIALLPRVMALRDNFSVYDAVYVALAESIGAALITLDQKLATAVRSQTKLPLAL